MGCSIAFEKVFYRVTVPKPGFPKESTPPDLREAASARGVQYLIR